MRILIVGGTGLISTSLTRQLLDKGHDVTLFNRSQRAPNLPLPRQPTVISGDRLNHAEFEGKVGAVPPFDAVIDMIGYLPGDAESLVRAFSGRAKQLLFTSTVDVYAKPASHYPVTEEETRKPLNDYGRNKVLCEDILLAASQRGDLPVTIIRPGHTYGEGGGVFHSLVGNRNYIDRLRKGKPIVVHGDGTSLWCAAHIDDQARAFIGALGNDRALGKAYHTTGEEWVTWKQLAQIIAEAAGAPPPHFVEIPSNLLASVAPRRATVCADNFFLHNIFDNRLAKAEIGYRYTISLREGMQRAVRWLDEKGLVENSDNDLFYDKLLAAWDKATTTLKESLAGTPD